VIAVVRHVFAILVLPGTVLILIPVWIARTRTIAVTMPGSSLGWVAWLGGFLLLLAGGVLFIGSLRRFGIEGRGTLAPWDPPRALVVQGPYAYVRHPMISGVILLLLAEAAFLRSMPHLQWAGLFFLINAVYIPLLEEPMLRTRFGGAYDVYRKHVPRLIPRLHPWTGDDSSTSPTISAAVRITQGSSDD
jgi:protein-S-isoprenylcysteine O-methyltransferase Ste14